MFFLPLQNDSQKLGLGICFAISPVQSNPAIMSSGVLGKHSLMLCVSCVQHQILPGDRHLRLIIKPSRTAQHKSKAMQHTHIGEFAEHQHRNMLFQQWPVWRVWWALVKKKYDVCYYEWWSYTQINIENCMIQAGPAIVHVQCSSEEAFAIPTIHIYRNSRLLCLILWLIIVTKITKYNLFT